MGERGGHHSLALFPGLLGNLVAAQVLGLGHKGH
jgi:hypothetical protein